MWWYIAGAVVVVGIIYFVWGNLALKIKYLTIQSKDLPPAFSGLKIAHVSDVHNTKVKKKYRKTDSVLQREKVDAVFLTGDLIDSRITDIEVGLNFAKMLTTHAPVYYVLGNHESRLSNLDEIIEKIKSMGINVLINSCISLEKEGDVITLAGIVDPAKSAKYRSKEEKQAVQKALDDTIERKSGYIVLLAHRPEQFDLYIEKGVDLVFSGHAHGGQIQLPLIGGVYAPAQGVFPKYDKGIFEKNDTKMILSGGMGNGFFATRIFNRPELLIVEIL